LINRRPTGIDLTSDPHSRSPKATDQGRRILTWAPEPIEDAPQQVEPEPTPAEEPSEVRRHPGASSAASPAAVPRRVPKRIPKRRLVLPGAGPDTAARPPAAAPRPASPPKPAAPPPPEAPAAEGEGTEGATRKRGRPRGRAVRRQVHFHVDPLEEQLLVDAVQVYGSQQKALIAALAALKETERLHDEIDRLRDECARQRRLLQDAKALFKP